MRQEQVYRSYALGLLWVSLVFAIIAGVANIVELVFVDFVHGNPHRPQSNAIEMMWTFTPLESIIAMIGCFLVFTLPQASQAVLHKKLMRSSPWSPTIAVVSAIPVISILTWYCWEYLTPTDVAFTVGDDWRPYQHGMTLQRYFDALAFQMAVSLYSLFYCEPHLVRSSKKVIVVFGSAAAVVLGCLYGRYLAEQQYHFL